MNKKDKTTIIVSIIALVVVLIGATYGYFGAKITGLENASVISLSSGRMYISYSEGNENVQASHIYPREEAWITKTFSLTGFSSVSIPMNYFIGLDIVNNTFPDGYLSYDLKLLNSNNGEPV